MTLLNSSLRWLTGRLGFYLLIVLILAGGSFAITEYRAIREQEERLPEWQQLERSLRDQLDESNKALKSRAAQLRKVPVEKLKARIREVDQSIADAPRLPQAKLDIAKAVAMNGFQQVEIWIQQSIRLELLTRERDYLTKLIAIADRDEAMRELEQIRQEIIRGNEVYDVIRAAMNPPPRDVLEASLKTWKDFLDRAWAAYQAQKRRVEALATDLRHGDRKPEVRAAAGRELALARAELERKRFEIVKGNVGYDNLRYVMNPPPRDELEQQLREKKKNLDKVWDRYKEQESAIKETPPLSIQTIQLPTADEVPQLKVLIDTLEQARIDHDKHWITRAVGVLKPHLWPALLLLVMAILTPYAIRTFFFYVLAPIATRRPAVALLPDSGGRILTGRELPGLASGTTSSVSCRVTTDSSNELLVHPEYLQSQPNDCATRTQWILNRHIPLTSIAAGLHGLTRFRAETPQTVVVSSTRDPLSEVSLITIPEGSSTVLLPRHIVGVLQTRGAPLRITRHWRLLSLHAWLTLQLRYLVFHGPVTLVVKGCRGVRIEAAEAGRSLNPAATMGFSANLRYASRRCETLYGYLSGQQPLLNDSFAGGSGYYIYQELPYQSRGGPSGRPLEGLLDVVLKSLGI